MTQEKNKKSRSLGSVKKLFKVMGSGMMMLLFALSATFALSACNMPEQGDLTTQPSIEQPSNPGTQNPNEPPNPGTDNPGVENPGEENPGEENPGQENPGTDNPEEENPGIDDPEEDPSEEEELLPPASIQDIFPSADADEETLNKAKIYQTQIINSLNDNLYDSFAIYFNNKLDLTKIYDAQWKLIADETDNTKVGEIILSFAYDSSDTSNTLHVNTVIPKDEITFADLYNGDPTILGEAFQSNFMGTGAKYGHDLAFSYNPSIQESSADLTAALLNQAFGDGDLNISDFGISISQNQNGDLEVVADPDTSVFIVDEGCWVDTTLRSEARQFTLFVKNDNGYQKLYYSIGYPNFDVDRLVSEVQEGNYRYFDTLTKTGQFPGLELTEYDLSQLAQQ